MSNRLDRFERRIQRRHRLQNIFRPRLRDRANPFEVYDEEAFKRRFHLAKRTVLFVFELVKTDLSAPVRRGASIPPLHQVLIALNFYATGSFQIPVGDNLTVCQATVSNVIRRVSRAIAKMSRRFIRFPTHAEAPLVREQFFQTGGFPGVVGAIDCTLIKINSPGGNDAELYRCRKQYFALNVQAICDANLCFTNIVARWFGSAHDARIFDNSLVKERIITGQSPGMLLGDAGYGLDHYLMVPLRNPVTPAQRRKRLDLFEADRTDPTEMIEQEPSTNSTIRGRAKQSEIIQTHFTN
ncbi:putative nuclease HARBI1 [Folsomia candida]|uniref:putative nuclease HARBI1 n=1 Tax=Folsomia candida TaxID=158441 RepID=UPI001604EF94|nr:putative nuclease HARBI1 [Folsomia candida]